MKKGQASLKDIAQALNISISTVSRALRGTGEVNPETRKASFEEVEQCFSPAEAVAEAERCLRCYRVVTIAV